MSNMYPMKTIDSYAAEQQNFIICFYWNGNAAEHLPYLTVKIPASVES